MNKIRQSLFLRLALLILAGTGVVLLLFVAINSRMIGTELLQCRRDHYTALAAASAREMELFFFTASRAVDEAAGQLALGGIGRENTLARMKAVLAADSSIMGSAVALAPALVPGMEGEFDILYTSRIDGGIQTENRTEVTQDYQSDWFYLPYHLKHGIWSDLYFDNELQEMMITYSAPVMAGDQVTAVVTCDLALARIQEQFRKLDIGADAIPVLLNRYGRLLVHPDPDQVMTETIYSLSEAQPDEEKRDTLRHILALVQAMKPAFMRCDKIMTDSAAWFYFEPIPSTQWMVMFVVPEKQILAPIQAVYRNMIWIAIPALALLLAAALLVSLSVTRPLKALCLAAEKLAGGDFDAPLPPIKRADEIGRLVGGFNAMRIDLKKYIENLASTTAAKEKIENELSIACEIQHSILPKLFPPFPKRAGLDIFAILESAREVGGDLYDFALLDDDHLYFCIGDVSGKGVPASLFMAVGKTLLKSTIHAMRDPAQTLTHVNNELADGNDSCMFITLFCGVLDLKTNRIIYANAGHNPPLRVSATAVEFLPPSQSPPLGAMEDIPFQNETLDLNDGEQLLLYTDGVTEAMNEKQELFGDPRLHQLVKQSTGRMAEKRIATIVEAVKQHAGVAEQSDDITLLCLSHSRNIEQHSDEKSPTAVLVLTNHREEFARMLTWLEQLATDLSWDSALLNQLNLALEEWVVNVVSHAFPDGGLHEIELRVWQAAGSIKVEIVDDGIAFDPTQEAAPDLNLPLEEREIGGLGLHFIQNAMDQFDYKRIEDRNVVTLVKNIG